MKMHPYVSFKGDCEAAFTFYEQHLDGQPGPIFRYAGTELAGNVPSDWSNKVMHGSITIGEQVLRSPRASRSRCRSRARPTPSGSFTRWPTVGQS